LVRDPAGPPIRSAAAINPGQPLDIEFSDGRATALATAAHGVPVKPRQPIRPRSRKYGSGEGQGSLF
jgi:exodeoxyribonuclease VII large subunit